jgi:hypothetical protein
MPASGLMPSAAAWLLEHFSKYYSRICTGELLVRAVRAVRAMACTSVMVSLARIEHGQSKQKLTKSQWLQKKEKCSSRLLKKSVFAGCSKMLRCKAREIMRNEACLAVRRSEA